MAKSEQPVPVTTAEDVEKAREDVKAARVAVEELRTRVRQGDEEVTHADIQAQVGVVEWLDLVADREEHKRIRYEEWATQQALNVLAAEIVNVSAIRDDEMLKLLDLAYDALCRLVDSADAHDAQIAEWANRATALGVPNRGVPSDAHMGLATSAAGDVIMGDAKVSAINVANLLRLLFDVDTAGQLRPTRSEERLAHARALATNDRSMNKFTSVGRRENA